MLIQRGESPLLISTPGIQTARVMPGGLPGGSAIPTFVAAGTAAGSASAITPGLPAGIQTDDILLLVLGTNQNEGITIPTPNGGTWTEVAGSPANTTNTRLTIFYSRYNGTQGDPTTSDSGDHQVGRIYAFRGVVNSGDPWDVTSASTESSSDTSMEATGDTTTVVDCLVAVIFSINDDNPTFDGDWTNSDLANITDRGGAATTAGNDGEFVLVTGEKASSGSYGDTTGNLTGIGVTDAMMTIALKP